MQGPCPSFDVPSDPGDEAVEFPFKPQIEGRGPVVEEDADVVEDFRDADGAQAAGPQHWGYLGVLDHVAVRVVGQQYDSCAVAGLRISDGRSPVESGQ